MQVSPLRITSLAPHDIPKEYAHLLPDKRFETKHVEFDLTGVSSGIANALRRAMMNEMSVVGLVCDGPIRTNDEYISDVEEILRNRVLMAATQQSTPLDAVYEFDVENTGDVPKTVTFGDMRQIGGRAFPQPVEPHTCAFVLGVKKRLKCTVKVDTRDGDIRGNGARQVACHVTSTTRDFDPVNQFEKTGTTSSVSNIRNWTLAFDTNGTATPHDIVRAGCLNIVERLRALRKVTADNIKKVGDEWNLAIDGTHTISVMLAQYIVQTQEGVLACVAAVSDLSRSSKLRLKTTADPIETITGALDSLIQIFSTILESVK